MMKNMRNAVRLSLGAAMLLGFFCLPGCSDTAEFASSPKAKATKDDIQKTEFKRDKAVKPGTGGSNRTAPLTFRANDREAARPAGLPVGAIGEVKDVGCRRIGGWIVTAILERTAWKLSTRSLHPGSLFFSNRFWQLY